MNAIKIFEQGTTERNNLEKAAEMLTIQNKFNRKYFVSETYFDFSQGWKWTTVMYESQDWGCCSGVMSKRSRVNS